MRKKINAAVRIINYWKPRTFEDFSRTGLRLTYISGGAFRKVFQIDALPLVVKIPIDDEGDYPTCIRHSIIEIRKLKALREFSVMRPHLPKVYYFDKRAGVVVMEYVDDRKMKSDFADTEHARAYGMNVLVTRLIRAHTGVIVDDFGEDNVRFDKKTERIKLIDLAY